MRLQVPPGRAGRPWLTRRLEIAGRGADVLDEKRRALLREQRRLAVLVADTREAWERAAAEAERWLLRAALEGGERGLELAGAYVPWPAQVHVSWRNSLGVVFPEDAEVELPLSPLLVAPGGGSSLAYAVLAHREAVETAARHGAARAGYELVSAELVSTLRRLRAIERRWIPAHEAALAALTLALDETEREDAARVRWVSRRRERQTMGAE